MQTPFSKIRWGRIVFAGIMAPLLSFVVLFLVLFVYGFILAIQTGGRPDTTRFAPFTSQIFPWAGPILAILLTFGGAVWVARRVKSEQALHGLLVGVVAALIGLVPDFFFGGTLIAVVATIVLLVLAGWVGGRVSGRQERNQAGSPA